jgi:hypothetical protein
MAAAATQTSLQKATPAARRANSHAGWRQMSAAAQPQRHADRVAGFLCAFSFALSGIAVTRNPGLLATAAILVALVAVLMTKTHQTLAAVAVAVAGSAFVLGMVVAVLTDSGLY